MAKLFGFELQKSKKEQSLKELASFAPPVFDDGAITLAASGTYSTYLDLEGTSKTESELISRYRQMSQVAEIIEAIDKIVNESIVTDEEFITRIKFDKNSKLPDDFKQKLRNEFDGILKMLDYTRSAYELFKRWYVDGRLYFHTIIDPNKSNEGIQELRYVDPRNIRKVREIQSVRENGFIKQKVLNEYYIYSDKGFLANTVSFAGQINQNSGIVKIAPDSVVYVTSGLTDPQNSLVLSHLHPAIKPLNEVRILEDATIIYRVSRAPERRVFYIDVGQLPGPKAEQYLREQMNKNKTRLVYDSTSGQLKDDRKFMTMIEDFWFPRRDGSKGTEVETLPPGQNLGEMRDVEYFLKRLYKALKIPVGRLEAENSSFQVATMISRDELDFSKFIDRLRTRFSSLFYYLLQKQLILKNMITPDDWPEISQDITFEFAADNHQAELKDSEIMLKRVDLATQLMPFIGRYFSNDFVRRNIFKQDDEDVLYQDKLIQDEMLNPQFAANLYDDVGVEEASVKSDRSTPAEEFGN